MRGVFLLVSFGSPKRSWNPLPNSYERRSPPKTRLTLRSPSMVEKNVPKKKGPIFLRNYRKFTFQADHKHQTTPCVFDHWNPTSELPLPPLGQWFQVPAVSYNEVWVGWDFPIVSIKFGISVEFFNYVDLKGDTFCALYKDLSRGHTKWWFSTGILPKMALYQVKGL